VQRKGWKTYKWEEVLVLAHKEISPWHLLARYVALTASQVEARRREGKHPGTSDDHVLLSLQPPFLALSADRIGSITKGLLFKYGVEKVWGAHSTRGAGVSFYKDLGLSSEQVCEIGKWKNSSAFAQHYLRLGAPKEAGRLIEKFVHKGVSPGPEAEPDRSFSDLGGSVMMNDEHNKGEARFLVSGENALKNANARLRTSSSLGDELPGQRTWEEGTGTSRHKARVRPALNCRRKV
jgi:hypothetical protein